MSITVRTASRTRRAKEIMMKLVPRIIPSACALAWVLLATPCAVDAHPEGPPDAIQSAGGHDRPGPPPIMTTVTLVWIEYPYKLWADDAGSYAEIAITTAIHHED